MNASDARIRLVAIHLDRLEIVLSDGSCVSAPLHLYPTLGQASDDERSVYEVYPRSVHWPLLDVDLGIDGIIAGAPELPCYVRQPAVA